MINYYSLAYDELQSTSEVFQNPHFPHIEQPASLYIHLPFCHVRCTYCAFNVVTNAEKHIPAYIDALCNELRWLGQSTVQPIHTLYFGGGTPSLLSAAQIGRLLATCRAAFRVLPDAEISLEANPTLIAPDYFDRLRAEGVNRLSIGMQSAVSGELRLMRRDHEFEAVPRAVDSARRARFENINLDLIFGLPGQTLEDWGRSIEAALALRPDHLSMYALELEDKTALTVNIQRGKLTRPDDDLAAQMYDLADEIASHAGFHQYEISNWAQAGHECRHNLQYWDYAPYLGVGAGAHGFAAGVRYQVVTALHQYIKRAASQIEAAEALPFPLTAAVDQHEAIDLPTAMREFMFTGLRKVRTGISLREFEARFGVPLNEVFGAALDKLCVQGLLTIEGDQVRLSRAARLISNRVSLEFM